MASKTLKGLTIEIGGDTTKLSKALEDVDKKSGSLSKELGEINKLLKLDPTNTDLLAQKQKVLADAVDNTEDKLKTLKEAEKQVQKQFEKGEASEEQVRALQREIIATERKLDSYKNAAKQTADAVETMGDHADKAADDVEDLGESSDKAEQETEELGSSLDGTLSGALKGVAALAAAASAAIIGTVEATQEYRTAMGKLDVAFQSAEHSSEAAKATYKELQSILGDTDTAVEASTLLAQFCDTEEELTEMTNTLAGVYARFPDSLPVEALVESANETARAGQIAGNLADALNWAAAEGETFGVTMKKNINFTELEKKELDKLTASQKAEYEARKAQHDEIEEYNKAVEEAASAEDYFNLALQECSTQQERQQLIMSTLNRIYGNAGTQYKKTNKAVIEANKANEEWNETLAEVGEEMQPVVTEIKKMGATLLKDAKEPLKETAKWISDKLLPALTDTAKWVKKNGPLIESTLVGVATAMVAFKTATIATEVAQKGLKGALKATTVAQKALNLAQKASPTGLILTALVGAAGLLVALDNYRRKAELAALEVDVLTEEEKELSAAADEAAKAFREQQKATQDNMSGVLAEERYVKSLADELFTLADASGRVKDVDQARVDFILNELKEATGEEYGMVDGIIQRYDNLKESIYDVIDAKTAQALLDAGNAAFVDALKQEKQALMELNNSQRQYEAALAASKEKLPELAAAYQNAEETRQASLKAGDVFGAVYWLSEKGRIQEKIDKVNEEVNSAKSAYDEDLANYGNYQLTIQTYREAEAAALQGNFDLVTDLLVKQGGSYQEYADEVSGATRATVDDLYKQAIDFGIEAARKRSLYEKGMSGYTEEEVKEAEQAYEDSLAAWANAYNDAHAVGTDLGDGITAGIRSTEPRLIRKARGVIEDMIKAMKEAGDIHSPSRKTMAVFEDMGAGAEIGIENKTPDVIKAGQRQAAELIETYDDQNIAGQDALRGVAERQAAQQVSTQMLAASSNGAMLEKILTAIEKGQVLTIDGDTLVGATAQKMDNALGQRRALAARGALK